MRDETLVNFLVALAVDGSLRAQFSQDERRTLDGWVPELSKEAKSAILEANATEVRKFLNGSLAHTPVEGYRH